MATKLTLTAAEELGARKEEASRTRHRIRISMRFFMAFPPFVMAAFYHRKIVITSF